uniref:Uncharacterized protein n=1 Tax=Arundo donax TaxID=35708 RepID=A0A0A9C1A2_ARUDO
MGWSCRKMSLTCIVGVSTNLAPTLVSLPTLLSSMALSNSAPDMGSTALQVFHLVSDQQPVLDS